SHWILGPLRTDLQRDNKVKLKGGYMAQRTVPKPTAWVGWVFFAAAMLIAVGGMQIIDGLVSIFNQHYFVATRIGLVAFNYTTWGWVHLLLGIVAVLTGVGLLVGWT